MRENVVWAKKARNTQVAKLEGDSLILFALDCEHYLKIQAQQHLICKNNRAGAPLYLWQSQNDTVAPLTLLRSLESIPLRCGAG